MPFGEQAGPTASHDDTRPPVPRCISCSMAMTTPEHFPVGDDTKPYCAHCARPDGTMKSYDEALDALTGFLTHVERLDPWTARDQARVLMARMPAWRR